MCVCVPKGAGCGGKAQWSVERCRFNGGTEVVEFHGRPGPRLFSKAFLSRVGLSLSEKEKVESPLRKDSLSNIRPGWRTIVLLANWFFHLIPVYRILRPLKSNYSPYAFSYAFSRKKIYGAAIPRPFKFLPLTELDTGDTVTSSVNIWKTAVVAVMYR